MSEEVIYSFKYSIGAHSARYALLVGKLEVMKAKVGTKKKDDDPVQKLQYETTDSNKSLVFTAVNVAKLIFDNVYKSCKNKKISHMSIPVLFPVTVLCGCTPNDR